MGTAAGRHSGEHSGIEIEQRVDSGQGQQPLPVESGHGGPGSNKADTDSKGAEDSDFEDDVTEFE